MYTTVLKALSDNTRLRAFYILLKSRKELCICELVDSLSIRQYHVSRCLRELKIAGLVKERKEGRFVFYKVNDKADSFKEMICKLISSLPEDEFKADLSRMRNRLALRKGGKVIVTMGCKTC